jgi:archaellum component FlaC
MTKVTEANLAELKNLIISSQRSIEQSIQSIDNRLGRLEEKTDAIDNRLGRLEEKTDAIDNRLGRLEEKTDAINKQTTVIETRLDTWKPAIDKIPDLAEKVGELKNWRQTAFLIITAFVSGIFGWFLRGGARPS